LNSCSLDRFGGGRGTWSPLSRNKNDEKQQQRGGNLDLPLFQFLKHFFRLIVDDFLRSFPYVYISRLGPRGKNTKSKAENQHRQAVTTGSPLIIEIIVLMLDRSCV